MTSDCLFYVFFFFSSRRRHTRLTCDWSSDVCFFRSFTSTSSVAGSFFMRLGEMDSGKKEPATDDVEVKGQNEMTLALRAADKMAWVCDDWVQRHVDRKSVV